MRALARISTVGFSLLLSVVCSVFSGRAVTQPAFTSAYIGTNGWLQIYGQTPGPVLLTLEGSSNLLQWEALGVLCTQPNFGGLSNVFQYSDLAAAARGHRYYRTVSTAPGPTNDWRNQISAQSDPLVRISDLPLTSEVEWVKFTILLDDPLRVYYQDSTKYPFHYDFARERLPRFQKLSAAEFDAVSLRTNGQQAVIGAVMFPNVAPGGPEHSEYAIQFSGIDPYPAEQILRWFELVRSTVIAPPNSKALYFPSFEQKGAALANEQYFQAKGVLIGSVERWSSGGNQVYAPGWALGRLKYVPADEIASAYLAGTLRSQDILLTDNMPVDTPLVAGFLTLNPATPNSHTAILAASYGIPFAFLAGTNEAARALALADKEVLLQVSTENGYSRVQLLETSSSLDDSTRAKLLELKAPLKANVTPKERYGAYAAVTDGLTPADARFFGGKAANFGFLRRVLSTNSPAAIAFSFDLWDDFLDQQLSSGRTLRAEIALRLAGHTNFPPDLVRLQTDLTAIRDLFTKQASFSAIQRLAIIEALRGFPTNRNIRFRSSSNAEDSQVFVGAGLYDSYSGCLGDDLDGDSLGPCQCEPSETKERGVFRAMQKVYASFYNEAAFVERLRHAIDETQVGMAILVHTSVADEHEAANGVATLKVKRWGNPPNDSLELDGVLVTQWGAVSVTNPRSDAQPERVSMNRFGDGPANVQIEARSPLVPLGGTVMRWSDDYLHLADLLSAVVHEYGRHYPEKAEFLLDFEYKKLDTGALQIKQVRELPLPRNEKVRPFLLGGAFDYRILQGEGWGSILTRQRLKCRLHLEAPTTQITDTALSNGFYTAVSIEFLEDPAIQTLTNGFAAWPNHSRIITNRNSSVEVMDSWNYGTGKEQRTYVLTSVFPRERPISSPFISDKDISRNLTVHYSTPISDPWMPSESILTESVALTGYIPRSGPPSGTNYSLLATNSAAPNKCIVVGNYSYPGPVLEEPPGPPIIIKTTPLGFFNEIQIVGLISEPIRLRSYYAQAAVPAHHNWGARYVFEPRLDPELPSGQLTELNQANVRLLSVRVPPPWEEIVEFEILGLDGSLRPW